VLAACDASPPEERRQDPPLTDAPITPTREEADAKNGALAFLNALKNKDAAALKKGAQLEQTFRSFLPKGFDAKGKDDLLASAVFASTDPRLVRLAGARVADAVSGDSPGSVVVVVETELGTLQALEMAFAQGGYQVTRFGSDLFGDGSGRFVLDACSPFAAPFKVPKNFSPKLSFEACNTRLKTLEAGLRSQRPEAQAELRELLTGQPWLEHKRVQVSAVAREEYPLGQDGRAFSYGFDTGSRLKRQFLLGLDAYCSCLPSEAKK
jgi:hypothetical protein